MKFAQVYKLKEAVLADKREFGHKEKFKELEYRELMRSVREKIEKIEEGRAKELKYLRDLEEYTTKLDKRLGIKLLQEDKEYPPITPADVDNNEKAQGSII